MHKRRIMQAVAVVAAIAAIGFLYAAFIRITGLSIPCPFHSLTGLECPGCGITTACLAVLRGDIRRAWEANAYLFLAAPVIFFIIGRQTIRWIKGGTRRETAFEHACSCILLITAILWGAIRNII